LKKNSNAVKFAATARTQFFAMLLRGNGTTTSTRSNWAPDAQRAITTRGELYSHNVPLVSLVDIVQLTKIEVQG